ncbi:MAG: patatin-like phospholipase family protein, partial [Thermoproteota archaeon]|nr:patatin-like phospholipase family protein [Thermoproteota archaeon]
MSYKAPGVSRRHKNNRQTENVLVLQGGGSLGAFACGVYKALVKENIGIDIVAGTSMGAINAAIIAGSKSRKPEVDLENFWMELAESTYGYFPDGFPFFYDFLKGSFNSRWISTASINAMIFGVSKMFIPRWVPLNM